MLLRTGVTYDRHLGRCFKGRLDKLFQGRSEGQRGLQAAPPRRTPRRAGDWGTPCLVGGRGVPSGHARGRRRGRVSGARAGVGGGVSRGRRRRRRRRGLGARRSVLCWNVRLPRARGAAAERAPPRPGAPDPGGGGGSRDGRARPGGLSTLCSPTLWPSSSSTAPAPNFSTLPHPSPETPATKKSSRRRSGDLGSPAPPPRGRPVSAARGWGLGQGWGRAGRVAAVAGGGGRGRTRSQALSRADLQILWLRRRRPRRAGAGGRAGSGYTAAARGLGAFVGSGASPGPPPHWRPGRRLRADRTLLRVGSSETKERSCSGP
ncbi:uncharacterized protein [Macaca fascicularis]|uniref:uncharacterized protein n=1 Tax=Macaca fascicularis TaxID=9541 RepID=UPI003D157ED5